jgi:hypothetical protein
VFWHYGTFFAKAGQKPLYMKKLFTLACVAILVLASSFRPPSGLDDVINALRMGNANELSRYVDDNIEISLPGKSNSYSKSQGVMVLQDFFSSNGVKGFEVLHRGENAGGQFCVGMLKTRTGNYRTTFFIKTRNGKQLVKDISFTPKEYR